LRAEFDTGGVSRDYAGGESVKINAREEVADLKSQVQNQKDGFE